MTHDVNLGIGNYAESGSTGMFYHAPAGTALPTYPGEVLGTGWSEVGAVSADGITLNTNYNFTPLKNWANKTARTLPAEENGTVQVPVIDTTEESFKTIFGEENVEVTPAGSGHGKLVKVDIVADKMPEPEAYLFLMKDGDDMLMIGTTRGSITTLAEVAFQPNAAITWSATISADKWTVIKDSGVEVSS